MAVTASFQTNTLSVLGDNNDNTIEASRNAAGINPLEHFLRFGSLEGRLPQGDGIFA